MTLSYLFSRMGKSINKVSMMVGYKEYEIYCIQEKLEKTILEGNYNEAKKILGNYQKRKMAALPPHQQYIMKMKAAIALEQQDYARAQKNVEDAIEMTLPYFSIETLDKYLLGEEEWTLIIMWLQCGLYLGNGEVHKQCMTLVSVLDKRQLDVEMQIALYPKLTWLLAESLRQNDKEEQAESAVRKTLDLLVENTSLFFLPQMLEILMHIAVKKMDKAESARIKQQIDALKWSYESSGMRMPDAGINLWVTNRQNKIYLIAEAVRQERKQSNLTQDKLAEKAGLDIKTLSRIENGANLPKPGTFRKLMDAIDHEYEIYRTNLVTDDFSLLELEWEITRETMRGNDEKARNLLEKLEERLLTDYKENQQYLLFTTIMLDVQDNKLDLSTAIDLCIQAFEETRLFEPKCFKIVMLSMQETIIVNFIAKLYRRMGKEKQAILLLESVLYGFDNSKVEDKYHYKELSLILESLAIYCEISDELDMALAYCERGIKLQLICGKGGLLGNFLMQRTYIKERLEKEKENCQPNYWRVYWLLELLRMEKDKYALEKYYGKRFRRDIADDISKN
ncbi:MAG: helix-turn-helix transcriptional regulator [Ruminococcus sp.]|nr:helix-turn-helix transcriptional regulator [Ruminococcus sp.]